MKVSMNSHSLRLTPLIAVMMCCGLCGHALAQSAPAVTSAAPASAPASSPADDVVQIQRITVIGQSIGKGETRATSVVDRAAIQEQPSGTDPLLMLASVPGLLVSSGDALTGSFSMRLVMRGLNKEQIGMSVDGIPNGSTMSNGGSMPDRLLEPSNLQRVDISQSAGDIGTPSNQALGGFIDFKTRDPKDVRGVETEFGFGNDGYQREFLRFDTGELAHGLTGYVDGSHSYIKTWPGAKSGRSDRDHADLRLLQKFDGGSSIRATLSYNQISDNDYNSVRLMPGGTIPHNDGLTDTWTGNPAIDQNYRQTRGIDSTEVFAHVDGTLHLGESTILALKPYLHHQTGDGWFYVPYDQLPSNGLLYSPVAPGSSPTSVVQECYANQYQRTSSGALVPVPAVTYPTGVSAATLSAAGCPSAAKYAMNPKSSWGARQATRRRGGYETSRAGVLAEASTTLGESHDLRAGLWFENISRQKNREWYDVTDPAVSDVYVASSLYSITQDRHYHSHTEMGYVQDKMHLLDDRLHIDLGATYQHFQEDYRSPVEFNGTRALAVSSKLLPKLGALYDLTDTTEVFGSASKNFSAIPDTVFEGTSAIDGKSGIKPETSTNVDFGVRYVGKQVATSIQAFRIDYRNRISIQFGEPNGDIFSRDSTTTFENQGGIRSQGVEATFRAGWHDLELNSNVSYTNAKYTADTLAEGIRAGDPVLAVPKESAFAELTWKPTGAFKLAGNVKFAGKAAGTYDVVYNNTAGTATGTTPVIVGGQAIYPRQYMPAYTLFGLASSYKFESVFKPLKKAEIDFNVDNLFNRYYIGGLGQELTTTNPLTSGRYFLGSTRTFFVTLRAEI